MCITRISLWDVASTVPNFCCPCLLILGNNMGSLCWCWMSVAMLVAQIMLTLVDDLGSMQVTFKTPNLPATPAVFFWPSSDPSQLSCIVANQSNIHTFVHPPTLPDYITTITMCPLDRGTQYSYFVSGSLNDSLTHSPSYSFFSLPKDSDTLRLGIYGDLGAYGAGLTEEGVGGLLHYSENHLFDFIIHNGDLAYNLGSGSGEIGNKFLTRLEPISTQIPYIVTIGNHEFLDGSESFYKNWFLGQQLLGASSNSSSPLIYFSFDVGPKLHVVVISTEVYCEDLINLIPQYQWLEQDLVSVRARDVQPWVLVFGHRQMYLGSLSTLYSRLMRFGLQCNDSSLQHCDYTRSCDSGTNCSYSLEHLFNKYNIDMYFAGHIHTYNRMLPIAANLTYEDQDIETYINPQHPVYVVSGAAGKASTPPSSQSKRLVNSPTVVDRSGHSFTLLTLFNDTHLRLEQTNISDGTIIDRFWIEKNHNRAPWSGILPLTIQPDNAVVCK